MVVLEERRRRLELFFDTTFNSLYENSGASGNLRSACSSQLLPIFLQNFDQTNQTENNMQKWIADSLHGTIVSQQVAESNRQQMSRYEMERSAVREAEEARKREILQRVKAERQAEKTRKREEETWNLNVELGATPLFISLSQATSSFEVAKCNDQILFMLRLKVLARRLDHTVTNTPKHIEVEKVEQWQRPVEGNNSGAGAVIGGALGLFLGPLGVIAGLAVGGFIGSTSNSTSMETAERTVTRREPNPVYYAEIDELKRLHQIVEAEIPALEQT